MEQDERRSMAQLVEARKKLAKMSAGEKNPLKHAVLTGMMEGLEFAMGWAYIPIELLEPLKPVKGWSDGRS